MYADIHVWFMYCMHKYMYIICVHNLTYIHTCTLYHTYMYYSMYVHTHTYMSCMYHVCHVRCEVYYCTIVLFYITDMHTCN